jgi:TRAP-type C4-dicarboxylate transport system permease large subunit
LGLITPPVCVGVYVSAAILKTPPQQAFRAVPGFFAVGIVYSIIVMLLPWLSTWLPRYW